MTLTLIERDTLDALRSKGAGESTFLNDVEITREAAGYSVAGVLHSDAEGAVRAAHTLSYASNCSPSELFIVSAPVNAKSTEIIVTAGCTCGNGDHYYNWTAAAPACAPAGFCAAAGLPANTAIGQHST